MIPAARVSRLHRTVVTIALPATRVRNADYPPERTLPGAMARLLTEDWNQMTRAANASANHISRLDRWVERARRDNPALSAEQAERLAALLRREHYRRMGKLSAQARRLARQAAAEMLISPAEDDGAPQPAARPDIASRS